VTHIDRLALFIATFAALVAMHNSQVAGHNATEAHRHLHAIGCAVDHEELCSWDTGEVAK